MTRVKICGVTRALDARAAVAAGADLLGVILWQPSPRSVDPAGARRVREAAPDIELVGVFVDEDADRIAELVDAIGLQRVQLHGDERAAEVIRFGDRAIKGVRDGDVSAVPPGVPVVYDRPLGSRPSRAALEQHWQAARVAAADRPLLLSGALDPGCVGDAIRAVRPWGVDCARGTESAPGIKDHDRLRRFVAAVREVDSA